MTASADELRRRLYRPGATAADLDAYRRAAAADEAVAEAVSAAPSAPVPRRRRVPVAALALGAALCATAALVWTTRPATPAPSVSASPSADAERGATALQTQPGDPAERAAFIRALVEGGSAGLGQWLDQRAPDLPGTLATSTRSETIEFAGDGDRTVRLLPVSLGDDGGHVTVILVAAVDAAAGFTTARPVVRAGRMAGLASSASQTGRLSAGVPVSAELQYLPGERPVTLRVQMPDGVRWGAAVVFSD